MERLQQTDFEAMHQNAMIAYPVCGLRSCFGSKTLAYRSISLYHSATRDVVQFELQSKPSATAREAGQDYQP